MIHWHAPAGQELEPEDLKAALTKQFPDYPTCLPTHGATLGPSLAIQWNGFRLEDAHHHHVAQFNAGGVSFSRLSSDEEWSSFQDAALQFWHCFQELAEPTVIQPMGVRYINRILLGYDEEPSLYINSAPSGLLAMNLIGESFFHQDLYPVPTHPYSINWIRTIRPDPRALIVDIDVFMTEPLQVDRINQNLLVQRLREMRWIENEAFFNCITRFALEQFGA